MCAAQRKFSVYSDEVFSSTDLNRRAGEVLSHARKNPVTISRNNEQFALMRREDAAELISTLANLKDVLELFQAAVSTKADIPPAYAWVMALTESDRKIMTQEVLGACARATNQEDWEAVSDLIYEWKESALVAESGIIEDVLSEPAEEVPLTVPLTVPTLDEENLTRDSQ